jgi:hypothetical protein
MKLKVGLLAAALSLFAAAPASAGLFGDAVVIKRVQGGSVFKTVAATVGGAIEYSDNFFFIDVTDNELVFDAIANFSIGDIVYTIEGLDFDDKPATPNLIDAFATTQIFGTPNNPFGANRVTIAPDGKLSLSLNNTTGSGNGVARVTLGAPVQAPVPEPATWAMMIGGFALAGSAARRRTTPAVVHA